jgi:hypothetical protein
MHLSSYGRQIYSDSYRAMKHGPVPSLAYDIIKTARGDGYLSFQASELLGEISVPDKYTVIPKREADIKYLSKTDINCLIKAHEKVKDLDFGELKKASHDKAYDAVEQDEEISLLNIIESLENSKEILEYLNS